ITGLSRSPRLGRPAVSACRAWCSPLERLGMGQNVRLPQKIILPPRWPCTISVWVFSRRYIYAVPKREIGRLIGTSFSGDAAADDGRLPMRGALDAPIWFDCVPARWEWDHGHVHGVSP